MLSFRVDDTDTDLFTVLGSLALALQGDGADPITASRDALTALDSGLEKVSSAQTLVGARLNWIDLLDQRREATGQISAEEQTSLGGADLATTMTRLQEIMTVLEASQASFVRLANLSLFDLIR